MKRHGHKGKKLLTDDVADASNLVSGAIEGSEFLHCCSAQRVLRGTTQKDTALELEKKKAIEECFLRFPHRSNGNNLETGGE